MFKMIFFLLLMFSICLIISANSWMSLFIGLEINLFSFIPILYTKNCPNSMECLIKYFLIQALASSLLLFSLILNYSEISTFFLLYNIALMLKIGMAPTHFWLPEVMEGLSWMNCFILSTIQKIAPMIMIMIFPLKSFLFYFFIIINFLISGILGLNQISLRKFLAYSSINHMSWMYSIIFFNKFIWFYYLMIYSIISFNLMIMFQLFNCNFMNQLIFLFNNNTLKFLFCLNIISLAGLPPFLGFYPKWLIIKYLIFSNMWFLPIFMLIFTLLTSFFYLKFLMNIFLFKMNYKMNYYNKINFNIIFLNCTSLILLIYMSLLINEI